MSNWIEKLKVGNTVWCVKENCSAKVLYVFENLNGHFGGIIGLQLDKTKHCASWRTGSNGKNYTGHKLLVKLRYKYIYMFLHLLRII